MSASNKQKKSLLGIWERRFLTLTDPMLQDGKAFWDRYQKNSGTGNSVRYLSDKRKLISHHSCLMNSYRAIQINPR